MISVIIPTFNESNNINTLIPYLKDCDNGENIEIIVADSPHSIDEVQGCSEVYDIRYLKCKQGGRAHQMNEGADLATFDIYYFLHADARPPKNFIDEILKKINSGNAFGIFSYRFDSPDFLLKCNAFFTRFDGLFAGGGDQSFFIRKKLFLELGGYDEHKRIMEDFDLYRRAKNSGSKHCIIKNPLTVSSRKYKHNSWLKVNVTNLRIFILYLMKGSQDTMIRINRKLSN